MNDFSNRFQFISRCLLIAGVLFGLCFSSGEGIQLLPFPASLAHAPSGISLDDGTLKNYSPSVHSCAAGAVKTVVKAQKDLKIFDCAADLHRASPNANLLQTQIIRNNSEPRFFKNDGLPATPSDRAPPAART